MLSNDTLVAWHLEPNRRELYESIRYNRNRRNQARVGFPAPSLSVSSKFRLYLYSCRIKRSVLPMLNLLQMMMPDLSEAIECKSYGGCGNLGNLHSRYVYCTIIGLDNVAFSSVIHSRTSPKRPTNMREPQMQVIVKKLATNNNSHFMAYHCRTPVKWDASA